MSLFNSPELITITAMPDSVAYSWITTHKHTPFALRAYHHISLDQPTNQNSLLSNPTHIKNHLHTFLKQHRLHNPFVSLGIASPSITEQFIQHTQATAHTKDLGITPTNDIDWHYTYVYPHNDQFIFYAAGIPHATRLQWQLLLNTHTNLIAIRPQSIALLQLYKQALGSTFRHSTFGITMQQHNNDITQLATSELLTQQLTIQDKSVDSAQIPHLLAACGLMVAERFVS